MSRSKKPPIVFSFNDVNTSYTKKKKKPTKLELLIEQAEQANEAAKIAKRALAEASTRASKMEIESLKRKYENTKDAAENAKRVATAAAIAKKRANNNAAMMAALEKIEENRERNEEEATKEEKYSTQIFKTEAQKAFEKEFEEKEAAKTAMALSRKAKRNVERIKNETRKLRVNNIAGRTSVKRKDINALLNNVNAQELELNAEEIAHIITLAYGAKVDIEDVLSLIKSKLVYSSEEEAIAFLKLVQKLDLNLEAFLSLVEKKNIPFAKMIDLLKNVPTNYLSEAEVVYILELAYMASVPVFIALELFEEEGGKTLTPTQKVNLMRLAYLSSIPIDTLLTHLETNAPFNDWSNEVSFSNAMNELKQMRKDKKTFAQILKEKEEREEETLLQLKKSPIVNRTKLINTLNNKNRTKKAERPTYKSIATRRINEVKETYTGLKVNNLPIDETPVKTKKDLQKIADILRGCFRGAIFGKQKGIPEIKTVYIPLEKTTKVPKGYAFVEYQTHEGAKRALDYMKNPETKKPIYGKTDHEIKGKDVVPAYGEEFFKYSDDKA